MSLGFDRDQNRRQRDLTIDKNVKGKCHVRFMFKDVFGVADNQENATYGLGYSLTKTKNVDISVLNKANATIIGKMKTISNEGFVLHYTPSVSQHASLSKQISSETPTELQCVEWSVHMKEVITKKIDFGTRMTGRNKHSYLDYCWFSTNR